jgi:hypothetical protein
MMRMVTTEPPLTRTVALNDLNALPELRDPSVKTALSVLIVKSVRLVMKNVLIVPDVMSVLIVKTALSVLNVKRVRLVKNAKLCVKNALLALSVPNTSLNALHVPSLNLIFPFVKSEKIVLSVPHVLSASQR